MLDRIEPEPVIAIAARIAPFDHRSARIIMDALAHHADALDLIGGTRRDLNVYKRARGQRSIEQRLKCLLLPGHRRAKWPLIPTSQRTEQGRVGQGLSRQVHTW